MEWVFIGSPPTEDFDADFVKTRGQIFAADVVDALAAASACLLIRCLRISTATTTFPNAWVSQRSAAPAIEGAAISQRMVENYQTQCGVLPATFGGRPSRVARACSNSSNREKFRRLRRPGNHR